MAARSGCSTWGLARGYSSSAASGLALSRSPPAQPAYTSGAASDFEEVESDNDLPF